MIDEKLINKLVGLELSMEDYMIMYLLHTNNLSLLETYKNSLKLNHYLGTYMYPIRLQVLDYIDEIGKLTPKFEEQFKEFLQVKPNDNQFDTLFKELKKHYPVKIVSGKSVRRLHSNPDKCKKLYKKILESKGGLDVNFHNHILKCIDFEVAERKKGGKEEFWQLMPTYLHQRSWELVEEDLNKIDNNLPTKENTNYEVI